MKYIGVMGNKLDLPLDFPLSMPENSGNMVHANAPFQMFGNCVYIREDMGKYGEKSFSDFVNNKCSHLIITLANTLRLGGEDGSGYASMCRFVEKIEVPVVIFGLGVQTNDFDLDNATLPPAAIEMLQLFSKKSEVVGVRGDFTRKVIERLAGVRNVSVVGCPSFFSRPYHYKKLLAPNKAGKSAYAGTNFMEPREFTMLVNSIKRGEFLFEPSNRFLHASYIESVTVPESQSIQFPYFFKTHFELVGGLSLAAYRDHMQKNYRCFRNLNEWFNFYEELVNFTYGTRFHVNMASILSGVKALWVTHDVRTVELTNLLSLPAITLEDASNLSAEEMRANLSYEKFFDNLGANFARFNSYLKDNGLPQVASPV